MESQKSRRTLKYEFTHEELLTLGRDLSIKNQELRTLEDQKKSVVSEFTSRMTIAKEQIGSLSDKLSAQYEMRDVICMIDYHTPERDMKTITRTDIGESWEEKMNDTDHNLFNTWEQKQREENEFGDDPEVEDEAEDTMELPDLPLQDDEAESEESNVAPNKKRS